MRLAALAVAALLAGCSTTQPNWHWIKPGATQAEFDQHKAQCDYETSAATQGTDYGFRTILGQELDRSTRKRDLFMKCMTAKGYRQEMKP
jgi:hypothetical protein